MFSALYLKAAYNQVPLTDDSKDLTAFIIAQGVCRWTKIPFGLISAPSFVSKLTDRVYWESAINFVSRTWMTFMCLVAT